MRMKDMKRKKNRRCVHRKQFTPGRLKDQSRITLLRNNNQNLARALSDQKIETKRWYTEAITLKGELQELQVKMLRVPDIINLESVFGESEKQIQECYESINKDFNSALERIVQAVEKLTKVKQLMGGIQNILQNSWQGPSSIFTRTPGSRIPLRSSGSTTSPRQRAVHPMVGGHVLQPVMVPLPKLKISGNARRMNNCEVVEHNGLDMSTIGEQSSHEANAVSEEQQALGAAGDPRPQNDAVGMSDDTVQEPESQNEQDTANLQNRLGGDACRRYTRRSKANSPTEPQVTGAAGVEGSSSSRTRRGRRPCRSRLSESPRAKASENLAEGKESQTPTLDDNDPLEGPSWMYGTKRSRHRYQRKRTQDQGCAKREGDAAALGTPDEDADGSPSKKKVASPSTTPTDTSAPSSDHSCLSSPTYMLARLESLETAGGRKSKRFLKKRRHGVNLVNMEDECEDVSVSLQQDEQQPESSSTANTDNRVLQTCAVAAVSAEVDPITDSNKEVPSSTSSTFTNENPLTLKEDLNTTSNIITTMDLTVPVLSAVTHVNPAVSIENNIDDLQDEVKSTTSKNKFFKTKEMGYFEEVPDNVEKTPFDLSMLNESVVHLPPFSSTRTTEKENLPPLPVKAAKNSSDYGCLCAVSVVLEDFMKHPEYSKTLTYRSVTKTNADQHTVQNQESNEEVGKAKRARKTKRSSVQMSADCSPKRKPKRNCTSNSLSYDKDTIHLELEQREARVIMSDILKEEDLDDCIVLLHKTPVFKSEATTRSLNNGSDVTSSPSRQQPPLPLPSEMDINPQGQDINPQGQEDEVEATSAVCPDTPSSSSSSSSSSTVNTEGNNENCDEIVVIV